ncbi:MAG TPA: TolC family protein, partial [Flavisolibacter sp.]|nr:TolC family protein [Flavisolibacter sp.]
MKDKVVLRILFFVCMILCQLSALKAQEKRNISIKEAVDLSIKNSKQLKLRQAKIEEAVGALKESQDRKLPDGSVSASYLRLNNPAVDLKIKSNNSSGSTSTNKAVVNQAAYALINASLPLYAGGRIRYGIESSKYLVKAA